MRLLPSNRSIPPAVLADAVDQAVASDLAHFAPPGHKRAAHLPLAALLAGDITLLTGVDDQRLSRGLLQAAEAAAAAAWGADWARLSVHGATHANQAVCLGVGRPGGSVVVARTCHKSIPAALVLAGLRPVWVMPEVDAETGLTAGVAPDRVAEALRREPEACAVLLTEPSYFGAGSDVAAIARVAHGHGVPVVVDQAWGAHFGFHPRLPAAALASGADIVVTSVHKTLPAFSQSALLLARDTGSVDLARLAGAFDALLTTSPSAAIYASIDRARALMSRDGERLLDRALALAAHARSRLGRVPGVTCADLRRAPSVSWQDPLKLVIDVGRAGVSGWDVDDALRAQGVQLAYADERHLVAVLTVADRRVHVDRLCDAIAEAVRHARRQPAPGRPRPRAVALPRVAMSPREAFFAQQELVPAAQAAGRVAAELVAPYPPGIAALIPGEHIDADLLEGLRADVDGGLRIVGPADPSLATMRVVA